MYSSENKSATAIRTGDERQNKVEPTTQDAERKSVYYIIDMELDYINNLMVHYCLAMHTSEGKQRRQT